MKRKTALTKPPSDPSGSDDLMASRAIVRLREAGSFSATARTLGVSVSAVTRALQRAEERLGVALFLRSTHGISPTPAGRRYAEHLARWLSEEESMRESLAAETRAERGSLRVTVPVFVAEHLMQPVIAEFQRTYPQVFLDVHVSDDMRDLIKEGFDLAVRLGPLVSSNLRMRALASFRRLVVVSPDYFVDRAAPSCPSQLAALPCLLYGPGTADERWDFWAPDGELHAVSVTGPVRSNNLELVLRLAQAGLGVARLPDGVVSAALQAGTLVEHFSAYRCSPADALPTLYAVHPKNPGKDRLREALVELLRAHVPALPARLAVPTPD